MRATLVLMLGLMAACVCIAEDKDQIVKFEFGATLNAVLADTVDARKSKRGDIVRAKVSEDVKAGGLVVIPRGCKLVGQVTEAQTAPKSDGQARLGIEFNRAELKDGRRVPLHTTFYALAAPAGASSDQSALTGGFGGGLNGGAAVGDMMSGAGHTSPVDASGSEAARAQQENLKPSSGAIGGLNGSGMLYASSRGVFGLEDISLEPNTVASAGSLVILATAKTVHLSSGTRMLLSVESSDKP